MNSLAETPLALLRVLRHLTLKAMQARNASTGKAQQGIKLIAVKGCTLCCALHFHKAALTGHGHVHVGVTVGVLCVIEVQNGRALIDAHRDSSDLCMQGRTQSAGLILGACLTSKRPDGIEGCQPGARDARRASAAIGLEHITVQGDCALAQGF